MSDNRSTGVHWRLVGLFYAIAFGGAVVVAALIWALGRVAGDASPALTAALTALAYMPLPLVAGLITERVAGRRYLIGVEWRALKGRFWRAYLRSAAVTTLLTLAVLLVGLIVGWLAGLVALPGAGRLVREDAELHARMIELAPALAGTPLPSIAVLAGAGVVQGILAGVTINGLFAFGEEYGWRGVLTDLLAPLGRVRATLLIGVLWGLWHAPIIMLGHNYGTAWAGGILVMVLWTTPLAFLLDWSRRRAGTVLAPAMAHGAYNGAIGLFSYLIIGANVLVGLPVGVLAGVALAVLAAVVWSVWPRPASGGVLPVSPAAGDDEPAYAEV
ncbi:CPBP family intramembrane glutamic endopeptidase [Micropruina sonneratiae]|uniref:CPBP family intramembrane glutamic endopeptidase n=1 Tax=Micropruina sonneratiae TaxID=2986940 RepID=UPI0022274D56|nr:CPBP family intramembrane glutamic endopeptidase [Micropruina sp. KQZ13P-5]MCW3159491.1 CPBP family intramembrane metalloprotease [Micropruina sp. KQZ13P-5]